jgi:predicted dehydrogenase
MRFGLVGAGPWASIAHGPGLVEAEGVELVGVWGRSTDKAQALAATLDVRAYEDADALLADVEAVAFAVPPDVQAELAVKAARAGKHLLLEKPVALDLAAATAVRAAATDAGVASVVFFTDRFFETSRAWFGTVRAADGWRGGWLRWFSALQQPGNPFGSSSWRRAHGALWDTGPHALSTLGAALGPVSSVRAVAGEGDLVVLVLQHEPGPTSTVTLTQFAPPAAAGFEAAVWGEAGLSVMPLRPEEPLSRPLTTAAEELVTAARTGQHHEVDVSFGVRVVELLVDAQAQLDAARAAGRA